MKKDVLAAVIVLSFFLGGTVAGCEKKVCDPNSVRTDSVRPGRYWLCNSDGTKEAPYEPPRPSLK